jgi:Calx-beta domain
LTPATAVSVVASTALALEQNSTPGVFRITRTPEQISNPLTVSYTLGGSATYGVDYGIILNQITIGANQTSADITITPIDDSIAEPSETVVLTIKGSGGYSVGFPLSATVSIADNETPELRILSLSTNIYQGNPNDYAALGLRRLGQTNVDLTLNASDFAFGGDAVSGVDYYLTNLPFTIPAGAVNYSVNLIYPRDSSRDVGSKSIVVTNLAGAGYTVSNNTASTWLTLKAATDGPLLFSDDFESDPTGANWDVTFATFGGAAPDYNVVFGYNYAVGGVGNLPPIPPAPHSTNGDTHGLYLTVNKGDETAAAAALNLYLKNRTFSGNYALRFDMFLVQNSAGTQQSKNETAIFGINHSGTRTNWIRNSVPGTGAGPDKFESDGLWCTVEEDASTTINFGFWSGPTYTNGAAVVGPTNFLARRSTTTTQIFKKPPFDAGPTAGGVPANTVINPAPTWVEVELSQIGDTVTWKMNNTVILSFQNTNANTSAYTQGKIMLGYNDPWDDIANGSANSGEACVIYDNVRVVAFASAPPITPLLSGSTLNLSFPTQAGFDYVLEWKGALTNGVWNALATNSGTGNPISVPAETQPDAHRFYRVRVE